MQTRVPVMAFDDDADKKMRRPRNRSVVSPWVLVLAVVAIVGLVYYASHHVPSSPSVNLPRVSACM